MTLQIKYNNILKKGLIEGYFGAKVDAEHNRVYLYFNGYFDMSCAEVFFKEYNDAKAAVDIGSTSLYVLAKNLKPFPQESIGPSGEVYKDYTKFKEVIFVEPIDEIARMQLHRVLREYKIEKEYIFVDDIEEDEE